MIVIQDYKNTTPPLPTTSVYIGRQNKIFFRAGEDQLDHTYISSILKDIQGLGYTFSAEVIERLATLSVPNITVFYQQLMKDFFWAKTGGSYQPMYPNFPLQVMHRRESELYLNAVMHYSGDLIGLRIMPKYRREKREPLLDKIELRVLELGTEEEFQTICRNLMSATTSISNTDKNDMASYVDFFSGSIAELIPAIIPHKENLAYTTSLLLNNKHIGSDFLSKYFKTATDILRLATAQSSGDLSLLENTKFRKFKRRQRRVLLGLLEQCSNITEDMLRNKERWLRLGEILHPGEYKKRFPKTANAFDIIRNDKPFSTFNSAVAATIISKEWDNALNLLKGRAGELARRLDHLMRNMGDEWSKASVVFETTAQKVSTPVLLQVMAHFKHRNAAKEFRTFFPKGNTAKVQIVKNNLQNIPAEACEAIVAICKTTLINRFKALPSLGKVYLNKDLENYLVPFSQRSASKSLRTIVRGSKVPMPVLGDTVRFFLWWKEGVKNNRETGRVDIDLSAVMYTADWKFREHISFTNLKSAKYKSAHSGDITSAPNGACEFIDLDIPSILKYGGRYVVMSVNSYTEQHFINMPECSGGWMMREFPQSGEIFDPRTVVDKIDVAADSAICIPVILDLQERKMIWLDLALKNQPNWSNRIEHSQKNMILIGKAMTNLAKANLYDLFALHVAARGTFVDTMEEADVIFDKKEGITPFDTDVIMGEYM